MARHENGARDPRDAGLDPATLAVVAGREGGPGAPLVAPPVFASAFRAGTGPTYARDGNPTWAAFEDAVAALEGACHAVSFASGMAGAAALCATLSRGSRVVVAGTAHVEVRELLAELAGNGSLRVTQADPADPERFVAACAGADMAWLDSISNPTLQVAELDRIAAGVRAAGATLVVDSTLATPMLQRPLGLGAHAVLHSASKYLGGHSDLLLGVVATDDPTLAWDLRERRSRLGSTPGTMEAWLALRGLRTLALRVERGQESAKVLAQRLAAYPGVERVHYPGLNGETSARAAVLRGPGAMISFEVAGGAERADAICEAVEVVVNAGSLGGVETLIERHARWHDEPSVPPALLRLSVGCENVDDLWRDLERAFTLTRPTAAVTPAPAEAGAELSPAPSPAAAS